MRATHLELQPVLLAGCQGLHLLLQLPHLQQNDAALSGHTAVSTVHQTVFIDVIQTGLWQFFKMDQGVGSVAVSTMHDLVIMHSF